MAMTEPYGFCTVLRDGSWWLWRNTQRCLAYDNSWRVYATFVWRLPYNVALSQSFIWNIAMDKLLRIVGFLEGISFLLLLFVAMPMKYMFDNASMIPTVGMAHGVLFLLFLVVLFVTCHVQKWPLSIFLMGLAASVLPFGPFVFDAKLKNLVATA